MTSLQRTAISFCLFWCNMEKHRKRQNQLGSTLVYFHCCFYVNIQQQQQISNLVYGASYSRVLIDSKCQLRMAGVLSSCVLCSPHHLICRFPRSPGALHSPPHIKASLISATLIFIHPMIIHLGLVVTCRTRTCPLSFTSVFAATFCIRKRMRSYTQYQLCVNADLLLIL